MPESPFVPRFLAVPPKCGGPANPQDPHAMGNVKGAADPVWHASQRRPRQLHSPSLSRKHPTGLQGQSSRARIIQSPSTVRPTLRAWCSARGRFKATTPGLLPRAFPRRMPTQGPRRIAHAIHLYAVRHDRVRTFCGGAQRGDLRGWDSVPFFLGAGFSGDAVVHDARLEPLLGAPWFTSRRPALPIDKKKWNKVSNAKAETLAWKSCDLFGGGRIARSRRVTLRHPDR
jgi:hypothetical protein